ncbi:tRNA(m(1)G37)methyltransferase [Geranomyces variabilis]|uniref:tRNA (guanine(37)-N1)-methyltransferase n=1 Tax=Geranomyces variabilis TaxID=109894 RepID=A0AAD5XSC8_9FUNG|nr:tRNA(m(1)G37)methyltransferase [Geranomyces variabilis]
MASSISPPANKGLASLNRALFSRKLLLVALRVPPAACARAMKELPRGTILDFPRIRGIVDDPRSATAQSTASAVTTAKPPIASKLVLLSPAIAAAGGGSDGADHHGHSEELPANVAKFARDVGAEVTEYELTLDYEYWTAEQVLRSILPDDIEIPASFETVGHIAHLNLRDAFLPYKHIIGQVLLDKNTNLKTIVNKTGNIDNTFRFFQMEVLAGKRDLMAQVNESGCKFKFDFSRVYWNSRLQTEHSRVVSLFEPDSLVCDVMAGVGPYAIPAAKNKNCLVFANDLNPASFEYLCENIRANKVEHLIKPYNIDGRELIRNSIKELNAEAALVSLRAKAPLARKPRVTSPTTGEETTTAPVTATPSLPPVLLPTHPKPRWFNHYVMNLPATAIQFLDAFWGLLANHPSVDETTPLPIIHCHCFSRDLDPKTDIVRRVEAALGAPLGPDDLIALHNVRNVAPNKDMLCVSFRLPRAVAFATGERTAAAIRAENEEDEVVLIEDDAPAAKRAKIDT